MTATESDRAGSLAKALQILDVFSSDHSVLGVRDIARKLGLPASTTGRIMATLTQAGVLLQDPNTRRYSMGMKVLQWARAAQSSLGLRDLAIPFMEELKKISGETVTLSMVEGPYRIIVERMESPFLMRYVVNPGDLMPLHCGASGKVLLAFMAEEERESVLNLISWEQYTTNTITDRTQLSLELTDIQKNGYSISMGERIADVGSVAAPVFNTRGQCTAALTISGPLYRLDEEKLHTASEWVVDAAQLLTIQLGYMDRDSRSERGSSVP
ncbi:MAG: IclR family transcriptional regulator [Anaerolineales bacterium]|nr:IclR family transcriptional regulator [Anaerolineales bacterium]